MKEVIIAIPRWEEHQNLEIEVRINGKNKTIKYHVEIVNLDDRQLSSDEKINVIKNKIDEFEKDWELIQISTPKDDRVSLMFRNKVPMETFAAAA